MAIKNADGSIILSTKVDTSGVKKGVNSLKDITRKMAGLMSVAFSAKVVANFAKETKELYKVQMENEVKLATVMRQRIDATDEQIQKIFDLTSAQQKMGIIGDEVQIAGLQQLATFAKQQETIETLLPAMNNLIAQQNGFEASTGSAVNVANLMGKVLQGQTSALTRVGITFDEAQEKVLKYGNESERAATLAKVITENVGDMNRALAQTDVGRQVQLSNTMGDIKEQFGEVVTQIEVFFLPVLKTLVNFLSKVALIFKTAANALFGGGENAKSEWQQISSSTGKTKDNIEEQTDAQKGLNKELKKTVAGFDELNTLSQDTGSGAGSEASAVGGGVGIGGLSGGFGNTDYVSELDEELAKALKVAGYALLVIGLILLGTGNFMLGVGFIVAGAGLVTIATASFSGENAIEKIKEELTIGFVIAGVIAIILGIILCVAGIFPQGIGLIVAGVASLVTAVAINWNAITEKINNALSNEELTKKFLVIGLILLLAPAFWQIAIFLIVFGITGMVKQEKLDFNKIKETIKTMFKEIGDWIKIFGTLVLGVMLCVTGVGLPIGIALILSGAGHLVDKVSLYWDKYGEKIKEFFNSVLSWVKTWGLLVLGIILIVSGVNFPLGLALLYKGAKNLTEAKDPNWFALLDKIKEVWKAIKDYWNANIAKYFTVTWWGNLAKNAINGFLKWIVSGLNKLADKINSFGFNLPDVLGGGRVGFNVPKLSVPQLARGAVLPPNKPFLAMVGDQKHGTNIEAPLDTIVQAFNMALQNNGGGGFNGRIEVPVIIDGRQIALAVREAENNLGSQTVFGGFANAY